MVLRRFGWLLNVGLMLWGVTAFAEGPGIRLGDRLVLHPGIGTEFRYDSNIFYAADGNAIGAFAFRLLPTLDLATRPPQRAGATKPAVEFRLHAGLEYNEWLNSDQNISQHRTFSVQSGLMLSLFPGQLFSVDLFDNYVRMSQPPYSACAPTGGTGTTMVCSTIPTNLDQDKNEVGTRFGFRPGGGRLELLLTYVFGLNYFEEAQFQDFDLFYHKIDFTASWKFLPKTALYLTLSEQPTNYWNKGDVMLRHPDSYPLRAVAGLNGLLTTKLAFNLWIGYGNGFYQPVPDPQNPTKNLPDPSPNTPIGGIEVKWSPTILSSGSIGYKHDFANSLVGSYYDFDMVYIGWTQLLWRFTGTTRLSYSNNRFQGIQQAQGLNTTTRTDNTIVFDLRVDYPFKDWLIASVGYTLSWNNSDSSIDLGTKGLVPLDYTKNEVFIRLAILY